MWPPTGLRTTGLGSAAGAAGAGPIDISLTLLDRRRCASGRGVGFSAPAPYGPGEAERAPGWYAMYGDALLLARPRRGPPGPPAGDIGRGPCAYGAGELRPLGVSGRGIMPGPGEARPPGTGELRPPPGVSGRGMPAGPLGPGPRGPGPGRPGGMP